MTTVENVAKPHVIVLFGATGDLARRKLLPGLLRLTESDLLNDARIVGTSMEDLDGEQFDKLARAACEEFGKGEITDERWAPFSALLSYVPQSAGGEAVAARVREAEAELGGGEDVRRLHYLSVPPKAALDVVHQLESTGLVERSRIVMEKPFGTDLRPAVALNAELHEVFARGADLPDRPLPRQGGGPEHPGVPVRQRPLRADLEPQLHRPRADRRPRDARPRGPDEVLREHRRLPRHGGHPPDAGARVHGHGAADLADTRADQRREAQGLPVDAADRAAQRRARPVHRLPRQGGGLRLLRHRDVHRDEGRDRQLALGRRAVLPADRQEARRGCADHLDRLQGAAAHDVPARLQRRDPGAGPPDLRPRRPVPDVAVVLRQAPRPGHEAGEAVDAVRHARHPVVGRRARGLRAAHPGRHEGRPHPVHDRVPASRRCGRSRPRCSPTRRRCAPTRRARGGPTRSTSWSPRTPGGCPSSAPGGTRTRAAS